MPASANIKANDITIEMSMKIDDTKAIPQLRAYIARGMWYGLQFFKKHFDKLVMTPLILGGKGWKSIEQYASWKWLNSPEGFGQLGFSDASEPLKLLIILLHSYEVTVSGKPGTGGRFNLKLDMKFFDIDAIAQQTIHPAAGKTSQSGGLSMPSDRSWFDWFFKGRALTEPARFVKTGPRQGTRSSIIAGSEAGLMTDKGSGLWSVPPRFRLDLEQLISTNEDRIVKVLEDVILTQLQRYLNS